MFKTRLLSGIVLVILALFLIISGHEILLFATLAISCIGMFELYRVFKMEKTVLAGVGYLAAIVYYCNLQWKFLPDLMILFMAFLILLMFVFVFAYPKFHADQVMAACGCDAFLCISDPYAGERVISCLSCIFMFVGMRYLCILRRNADRKAQDVAETQSEKIGRGCSRRCGRGCASDRFILFYFP